MLGARSADSSAPAAWALPVRSRTSRTRAVVLPSTARRDSPAPPPYRYSGETDHARALPEVTVLPLMGHPRGPTAPGCLMLTRHSFLRVLHWVESIHVT